MPKATRRGQDRVPALLEAIAARRVEWGEMRRARTPPSKKERELLDLLESGRECSTAWTLLTRPSNAWGCVNDHGEVLRLLLKSADIAENPHANAHAEAAVARRFQELTAACNLLIDYHQAQMGIYDHEIDLEEPLDESKPWPFKWAYHLSWMLDCIICEENDMLGKAVWTPGRPIAVGVDGEARMFEHVFSSLLRKAFGRPFDDFVLSVSRVIYPEAKQLEGPRVLVKFRKRERERHRRMLEGFRVGTSAGDARDPAPGSGDEDDG